MNYRKPLLIVLGEPNSTFIEILARTLNKIEIKKKIKNPIILIGSELLILSQLKILNQKLNFNKIDTNLINLQKLEKKFYLIDIKYSFNSAFENISKNSKQYITDCFDTGLNILNRGLSDLIINGPISKKHFLNKKTPGITEYVFEKAKTKISKNPTMLIFNKKLSVSPITTHIDLKKVNKKINKNLIINNVKSINNFYKKKFKKKPKIGVLGINPHCESNSLTNEENKIIIPAIRILKKNNLEVSGPHSADTFFLKQNIDNYDCVIGMYHDQVLTPFKTIFGFDASNITLGLPFLRISVDHGPNEAMMGKNKSNTKSLENIFDLIYLLK